MKQETINRIRAFSTDRDWDKYHTPNNLAKTIVLEANELLECFQWDNDNFKIEKVKEELADVIVNCQNLLDKLGLDVDEIINAKMAQNEKKYPVEKIKGIAKKYNEIDSSSYIFTYESNYISDDGSGDLSDIAYN